MPDRLQKWGHCHFITLPVAFEYIHRQSPVTVCPSPLSQPSVVRLKYRQLEHLPNIMRDIISRIIGTLIIKTAAHPWRGCGRVHL